MSNQPANLGAQTQITINGVNTVEITLNLSVTRIDLEDNVLKIFFEAPGEVLADPQVVPEESPFNPVDWDKEGDPDDYWYGDEGIPTSSLSDSPEEEPPGANQCPPGTWWCVECQDYMSTETHVFQTESHRAGVWCELCNGWH
jgi:hypothetical protein